MDKSGGRCPPYNSDSSEMTFGVGEDGAVEL
jgi:hypothetical protein